MRDNIPSPGTEPGQPGLEEAMRELQSIVEQLESGELPLADALAAYQRGATLIRHSQGLLDQVQAQIEVIEAGQERAIDRTTLIAPSGD
jgi:exodeoxyribonuclease VII small subunit